MSPRQQGQNSLALTSLRFFAASYVLVFHSGGPTLSEFGRLPPLLDNFLMNGYLGVTFFFVLSGFILTYVYYGRLTTQKDRTRYAAARFARISIRSICSPSCSWSRSSHQRVSCRERPSSSCCNPGSRWHFRMAAGSRTRTGRLGPSLRSYFSISCFHGSSGPSIICRQNTS